MSPVNLRTTPVALAADRVPVAPSMPRTAFLVLDTESVPDGRLLGKVKFDDDPPPEEAIERARAQAREQSPTGSDFLPVTFQYPVAVCVVRVASDFTLENVACLDAPRFRTPEIVKRFWTGVNRYKAKLVTFNGRAFDLPLLEFAAFRYGCSSHGHFYNSRNRYGGNHIDLLDWLTNYGACRLAGGLDLLAKLLGRPGKMEVSGDQVYDLYRANRLQDINDYCMFDTLDTYFVFLRTRVLTGDLSSEQENDLLRKARAFLEGKATELPALRRYLDRWSDAPPWP